MPVLRLDAAIAADGVRLTLPPLSVAFIKLLPADAGAEGAALQC